MKGSYELVVVRRTDHIGLVRRLLTRALMHTIGWLSRPATTSNLRNAEFG